jgi:hypothetical protein
VGRHHKDKGGRGPLFKDMWHRSGRGNLASPSSNLPRAAPRLTPAAELLVAIGIAQVVDEEEGSRLRRIDVTGRKRWPSGRGRSAVGRRCGQRESHNDHATASDGQVKPKALDRIFAEDSSDCSSSAPRCRALTSESQEEPRQVCLIRESTFNRDLRQRCIGLQHHA